MKTNKTSLALGAGAVVLSMGFAAPAAYADAANEVQLETATAEGISSLDGGMAGGFSEVEDSKAESGLLSTSSAGDLRQNASSGSAETSDAPGVSAGSEPSSGDVEGDLPSNVENPSPEEPKVPAFEVDDSIEEGLYEVSSEVSGKLLDVSGASSNSGANVQVWNDNSTPAQRWKISRVDRHYAFTNVASGKVLDVSGGSSASGSNVQQYQWNGTKAQLWDFVKAPNGRYYLRSCVGDKFLDVSGGNASSGANVQIYEWNGTPAQMWRLVAIKRALEDGTYSFASSADGSQVIDVSGASDSNGAAVQSYGNNDTLAQYWNISYDANTGYYEIRSASSGLALDVAGGGTSSGTKVQQYAPNGTLAQRWSIVENADGSVTFIAANSGLALDIPGGNARNGNQLQIYASNGTRAQRWSARHVQASLAEGLFQIVSRIDANRVLDVSGASHSQTAQNQVWSRNGTLAQKWVVKRLENGAYSLQNANSGWYLADNDGVLYGFDSTSDTNAHWVPFFSRSGGFGLMNVMSGKVLDIVNGDACAGGKVQLWSRNDTVAQGWKFMSCDVLASGYYSFANMSTGGKLLDVSNASISSGATVQLWQSNGSAAQKWMVRKSGDGTYSFVSVCSGKFLDVRDGNANSGAGIQQWDGNGTAAQKWWLSIGAKGGIVITSALGNFSLGFNGEKLALLEGSDQSWNVASVTVGAQPYCLANGLQRRIVETAKHTPSPGANLCSEWVAQVFEKNGQPYDWGDACDYFWSYCHDSNLDNLQVGMIIAVPSHSHNWAGSVWGHVCIYIGDGLVMDNVGYIRQMGLQDWMNYYGTTYTPLWGWYEHVSLA